MSACLSNHGPSEISVAALHPVYWSILMPVDCIYWCCLDLNVCPALYIMFFKLMYFNYCRSINTVLMWRIALNQLYGGRGGGLHIAFSHHVTFMGGWKVVSVCLILAPRLPYIGFIRVRSKKSFSILQGKTKINISIGQIQVVPTYFTPFPFISDHFLQFLA